ncbi:MAG: hypothetical protein KC457_16645 [Myxococcales bacterium]|nr:hypothetical protein [Myxococcales bacterium]
MASRVSIWSISLLAAALLACTEPREARSDATPPDKHDKQAKQESTDAVAPKPSTEPESQPDPELQALEAQALACDGMGLQTALAKVDLATLAASETTPASLRTLARWESTRRFSPEGDHGKLEAAAVEGVDAALTEVLGQAPPRWWIETLASASATTSQPSGYDLGLHEGGDRRGALIAGPGGASIRPELAAVVSESNGELIYQLSMGPLSLGKLSGKTDATLEIARAPGSSTVHVAEFPRGSGGFRFPLRAVGPEGKGWTAEVCGPNRMFLNGMGYLIVEIVVLDVPAGEPGTMPGAVGPNRVAVFTAESHGVAVDVFDGAGARVFAWSSDWWFSRSGAADAGENDEAGENGEGGDQTAEPAEGVNDKGAKKGQVCREGTRHDSDLDGPAAKLHKPKVRECKAGLSCCYPCGMAGCDWVCATRKQCESWRTLP